MRDFLIFLAGIVVLAIILLTPLKGYLFDAASWCWDNSAGRLLSWAFGVRRP